VVGLQTAPEPTRPATIASPLAQRRVVAAADTGERLARAVFPAAAACFCFFLAGMLNLLS